MLASSLRPSRTEPVVSAPAEWRPRACPSWTLDSQPHSPIIENSDTTGRTLRLASPGTARKGGHLRILWFIPFALAFALFAGCQGGEESGSTPTPRLTTSPDIAASATPTSGLSTPTPEPPCCTPSPAIDTPPGPVSGFHADAGGGSGEIFLTWQASPEPDVDHYNLYSATTAGGPYTLFAAVDHTHDQYYEGTLVQLAAGTRGYLHYFVDQRQCYVASAVDVAGGEGPQSAESCATPPQILEP